MDHSKKYHGHRNNPSDRNETNLATQSSLNVPTIMVKDRGGGGKQVESYSLDVRCFLQPQPNYTDGRHVLVNPVQAQLQGLPLSRQSDPA